MKVIVVGAGFTGVQLARSLADSGAEVVLVENDPERARVAREQVDCSVLEADGNSPATLAAAGLAEAGALVALTEDDEVNLITCALADAGFPGVHKLARVRNYAYYESAAFDPIARKLGVDVAVPLRDAVVDAIAGHLRGRNVRAVHSVCNRRFEIVECGILPGSPAAGRPLRELSAPGEYLLLLVRRPDAAAFEVPSGDTVLPAGGRAVLVMRANSRRVPRLFGE